MSPAKPSAYDDLEALLPTGPQANPWHNDATYQPDTDLLCSMLSFMVRSGATQASGRFAKAIDFWAAHELRRAGFDPDAVWPRATRPRVLTLELAQLLERYVPQKDRAVLEHYLANHSTARAFAANDAKVLGRVYLKQADVLMAHWSRGAELLISTKTMLSSYGKNLRNRFEESYGDASNLRGRFPLCALGFLFVVRSDIPPGDLDFLIDMLTKLTHGHDGYDAVSLLVAHWDDTTSDVILRSDDVPDHLGPGPFLATLTRNVLDRTPIYLHVRARELLTGRALHITEGDPDAEVSEKD